MKFHTDVFFPRGLLKRGSEKVLNIVCLYFRYTTCLLFQSFSVENMKNIPITKWFQNNLCSRNIPLITSQLSLFIPTIDTCWDIIEKYLFLKTISNYEFLEMAESQLNFSHCRTCLSGQPLSQKEPKWKLNLHIGYMFFSKFYLI